MSDKSPLAQALANLDEAMRPSLGGSTDPARRRVAQRLAQLARCDDEDLPAFAKRHMPGRAVEESALLTARDLLLAIGGIADMEEGGPDAWAALGEVKAILDRRVAEAKEAALKRKAEAEEAAASPPSHVAPMPSQATAAPLSSRSPVQSPSFALAPAPPLSPPPAQSPSFALAPAPAAPVPFSAPAPPAAVGSLPFTPSAAAVPPLAPMAATPLPAPVPPFVGPRVDGGAGIVAGAIAARDERAPHFGGPFAIEDPETIVGGIAPADDRVLPFSAVDSPPSSATSSQLATGPLPADRFTLAEYANLCAGVRAHPTHIAWIRDQYGLNEDDWTAVHAHWQACLQRDPSLRDQWQQMVVQFFPYWQR